MRRADRAITEQEAQELLKAGEYGVLATVSNSGQPYGIPVNYAYTGDAIYFHCAIEGQKVNNISENDSISFCVVGRTEVLPKKFSTRYESVIVFGKASEVTGDEKRRGLLELVKKYSPDFIEEGLKYIEAAAGKVRLFKISIESMTGKARR